MASPLRQHVPTIMYGRHGEHTAHPLTSSRGHHLQPCGSQGGQRVSRLLLKARFSVGLLLGLGLGAALWVCSRSPAGVAPSCSSPDAMWDM
jgi:hypothetical protein